MDGDDTITLRIRGSRLAVTGEAYWPMAHPGPNDPPGWPHMGSVDGLVAPTGRTVVVHSPDADPTSCRLGATLLPPFLVVDDNVQCGGANVTFRGVYRRR